MLVSAIDRDLTIRENADSSGADFTKANFIHSDSQKARHWYTHTYYEGTCDLDKKQEHKSQTTFAWLN